MNTYQRSVDWQALLQTRNIHQVGKADFVHTEPAGGQKRIEFRTLKNAHSPRIATELRCIKNQQVVCGPQYRQQA